MHDTGTLQCFAATDDHDLVGFPCDAPRTNREEETGNDKPNAYRAKYELWSYEQAMKKVSKPSMTIST